METVFSGIQPSGELHLGNYLGAVRNWVALQGQYRCFYCIVDYHAITQPYEPAQMAARARAMAIDVLACGVDPERATLFVQSAVPEHTELAWVLAAVTPFGELGRMTQFKDKSEHQPGQHQRRPLHVPGAADRRHPALRRDPRAGRGGSAPAPGAGARDRAPLQRALRRHVRGAAAAVLDDAQDSRARRAGEDVEEPRQHDRARASPTTAIWDKLRTAATDPARVKRTDPGTPEKCNIYTLHKFFSDDARQAEVHVGCTTAGIGCIDCKKMLFEGVKADLARIRARGDALRADPERVDAILARGAAEARKVAAETMARVRARLGLPGAAAR